MILEPIVLAGLAAIAYAGGRRISEYLATRSKTLRVYDSQGRKVAEFDIEPGMSPSQKEAVLDKALHQAAL